MFQALFVSRWGQLGLWIVMANAFTERGLEILIHSVSEKHGKHHVCFTNQNLKLV